MEDMALLKDSGGCPTTLGEVFHGALAHVDYSGEIFKPREQPIRHVALQRYLIETWRESDRRDYSRMQLLWPRDNDSRQIPSRIRKTQFGRTLPSSIEVV